MTATTRREVLLYAPRYAPADEVTVGDSIALGAMVAGTVTARTDVADVVILRLRTSEGSLAVVELAPDATVFVWRDQEEARV